MNLELDSLMYKYRYAIDGQASRPRRDREKKKRKEERRREERFVSSGGVCQPQCYKNGRKVEKEKEKKERGGDVKKGGEAIIAS